MIRYKAIGAYRLLALSLLALAVTPARASELSELRAELDAVKSSYQTQLSALEARVAQLEVQLAAASSAPASAAPRAAAEVPAPLAPMALSPPSGGGGQNAFNPAVSVILGGRYAQLSEEIGIAHV